MVSSAPGYGMNAPKAMLSLARRPAYLRELEGGNRLRQFWEDEMQAQFDPRKLPDFALDCFLGRHGDLKDQIQAGRAPNLRQTLTDFCLCYAGLVVLGAQRCLPGDAETARSVNHVTALELVLSHGADPNSPAINGATPLHFASAICGQPDLVRILLQHGADVNARDRYGQTPIFDAMLTDEIECIEALMEAGADVSIANADGITPLRMHPISAQVAAAVQRALRKRAGEDAPAFERKVCDGCQRKASSLSLCARCHTARYCSKECQRSAWKIHKHACTAFDGPAILTIRPTYIPGALVSTAPLMQRMVGIPALLETREVKTPSATNWKYPKPMIVKIQAPLGPSMTEGLMLAYDKRRDFVAYLDPSGGLNAYLTLRKIIAERGVSGGLKAYFAAELVTKDELAIKAEVLAAQEF